MVSLVLHTLEGISHGFPLFLPWKCLGKSLQITVCAEIPEQLHTMSVPQLYLCCARRQEGEHQGHMITKLLAEDKAIVI